MLNFSQILNNLLNNPSSSTKIIIKGNEKVIKGMARFASINSPVNEYVKIVFADGSFLLVLISDKLLYYADTIIGHIQEITDQQIGVVKEINYNNEKYSLANKDDYQYVLERYVGKFGDVEGECSFSDYMSESGSMLSLGWLSINHERADIFCQPIEISDIEIKK